MRSITKKVFVLHPFLFALAPVCFLFAHNFEHVALAETVTSVGLVLAGALVLQPIAWLVFRDKRKGGIIVSLFFLLFFSYGHVVALLDGWTVGGVLIGRPRTYLGVDGLLVGALTLVLIRTRWSLRGITRFLNGAAACFVAISVVRIGAGELQRKPLRPASAGAGDIALAPSETIARRPPNIYYIILDAYARADVLEALYGYDNSEFIDYLRQKGFYVATRSCANYAYSCLSLSSSLNVTYLDELAAQLGDNYTDRLPLHGMIQNSRVVQALRRQGYCFVSFASGYGFTEIKGADVYIEPGHSLNGFETALLGTTPIPVLLNVLPIERKRPYGYDLHRRRIRSAFDGLARMPGKKGPIFAFAHILSPHQPFVFAEDGTPLTPDGPYRLSMDSSQREDPEQYHKPYVRQLRFTNTMTREMIDRILSTSGRPPIIIIQADHGSGSTLDVRHPEKTNLKERMAILNAYYFPDQDYAELYDEITPVNTFRVILSKYFGASLELLKDESYFSTWSRPYRFINVRDRLDAANDDAPAE